MRPPPKSRGLAMADGTLTYYACGYTWHQLSQLMQGQPRERRIFPAGVFLYRHPSGAHVLFDTGYAPATWRAGLSGFLYHLLLPAKIRADQSIAAQLLADGIDPGTITHVVLSHLHPDHIGGVRYFPGATFVLSKGMRQTLADPVLKEGFLKRLLPSWFAQAKSLTVDDAGTDFAQGHDLFGDDSYRIISLPGHARGHLGALVEGRVLLAGDASWGRDLMDQADTVRKLPRAINDNWDQYTQTIADLRHLESTGVRLCFSHDPYDHKELLS